MKIRGHGIELSIGLSPHEIDLLFGSSLVGNGDIWDVSKGISKRVRLGVTSYPEPYMVEQLNEEGINVETFPRQCDFYTADRVVITLCFDVLSELNEKRYFVRRFSTGGKIKLYDLTRKNEVYR